MGSNWISCRRVKFQEIDAAGNSVGTPTFGVIVADDFVNGYNNTFGTLEELNEAIAKKGMIRLVENDQTEFDVNPGDPRWKDNYIGARDLEAEDET